MIVRFADTWFYVALLDRDDRHHRRTREFVEAHDDRYITTRWVLMEVANSLGATRLRRQAAELLAALESDANTTILGSSDELYRGGLDLFSERPDKSRSLTDCISFVVMEQEGLREALTGDRHFAQAGFSPVFAE